MLFPLPEIVCPIAVFGYKVIAAIIISIINKNMDADKQSTVKVSRIGKE